MAWKEAGIQRSFDPFQFMRTREHGIVWRGPIATYPHLVPREHVRATMLVSRRQALFEGRVHEKWMIRKSKAMVFAAFQCLLGERPLISKHSFVLFAPNSKVLFL